MYSNEVDEEQKTQGFSACYSYAKEKKLSLQNIESIGNSWYVYKDSKDKTYHVKYITSIESNIGFTSAKILMNTDFLVLVYLADNKLQCLEQNVSSISSTIDAQGHLKYNTNILKVYPIKVHNDLNAELKENTFQNLTLKCQKPIAYCDMSLTQSRYKSIMERNYLQKLNYLLFNLCKDNIQEAVSAIDTILIKTSFKKDKDKDTEIEKAITASVDGYEEVVKKLNFDEKTIEIARKYKILYTDMKKIRARNYLIEAIKKKYTESLNKYEKNYICYYQKNILSFDDFTNFWNKDKDRCCKYCGVSESQINSSKLDIQTKRFYSRGKTMEIDKKKAFGEYTRDNIILSCYWCNNAKTDEFSLIEFKCIAKGINKFGVLD